MPVLPLPAQTPTPPGPTPQDPYLAAQTAYYQNQLSEAAALAAQADETAHPEAPLLQARALARLNQFTAAEAPLRRFLAAQPRSAPGLYLLGIVLQGEHRPADSLAAFTRASALQTPRAEDLRLVALDYVLLGSYPDAIHWLRRATQLDPAGSEAWYDLGRSLMHEGDFTAAEQSLRRALALTPPGTPPDPRALNNLGLALEARNRPAEALTAYRQAITAQQTPTPPSSPTTSKPPPEPRPRPTEQPFLNLGTLLNTLNRAAEALAPLRQSIALTPTCARCHEELARALLQAPAGNSAGSALQAARTELQTALTLDPDNPRLHFQLGQLLRRLGEPAAAARELKQSADLYGTHSSTPEPK